MMHSTTSSTAAPSAPRRPGPATRAWGISTMRAMSLDYLGTIEGLQRAHGDIAYMRLLWEEACAVLSPELTRAVLVGHAAKLERFERAREVMAGAQGQYSVMVSEGETWQRQHRMLRPGFAPRRVASYAALMTDAAAAALDRTLQPHGDETEIELDLWTNAIAMDVILRTLFSTQLQPQRAKEITRAVQALDRHAMRELFWPVTLPDWLPLPGKAEKRWAVRTLKHFIAGHIAARQSAAPASAPQDDLLAMLLAARDEEGAEGDAALSAQEIHDQCQVIFLAGHETSATALQWWMLLMAKHRDALARAQQEIAETLQGQPPTADDAERLPWLMATIKEALRLYPPAPALMTRRAQADLPLETGTIPKGTLIFTLPWILQRDARWFPEPAAFKPERFLPDAPPLPRGAWMPFGTGPRVCIGQHLAMLELLLLTAMLLQRYDLQRPEGAAWPPAELHVTLRPPPGVRMKLIRR